MAVLAVAGLAATAQATPTSASGGYGISVEAFANQLGNGTWEYQYDIFGCANASYEGQDTGYRYWAAAMRFEFGDGGGISDHILNMYDTGSRMEMRELWTINGITGNNMEWQGPQPSYGDILTDTWMTMPSVAVKDANFWEMDPVYSTNEGFVNPFHVPSDYGIWKHNALIYGTGIGPRDTTYTLYPGLVTDEDADGLLDDLRFHYNYGFAWFSTTPELMATIRIVSDLGPYGEMIFWEYSSGNSLTGPVIGPGVPEPATMSLLALGGIAALIRRRK